VAASISFLLLRRFSSSSLCFSTSFLFLSCFFFSSAFRLLSSSCSFIPQNVFALKKHSTAALENTGVFYSQKVWTELAHP
jgi:hypothetical protein